MCSVSALQKSEYDMAYSENYHMIQFKQKLLSATWQNVTIWPNTFRW